MRKTHADQAGGGHNDWWRVLLTVLATVFGLIIGNIPMVVVLWRSRVVQQRGFDLQQFSPASLGIEPAVFITLQLLPFAFALGILSFCVWRLHGRETETLFKGSRSSQVRWQRAGLAAGLWFLLSLLASVIQMIVEPDNYLYVFDSQAFAKTLFVVAILIPFQVMFEESALRGYLFQQFNYSSRHPWISMAVVALLFACLHLGNPEFIRFGRNTMLAYFLLVGLFLGALTLWDDGLELALGVHLATNLHTALFVNFEGSALPSASVYQVQALNLKLGFIVFCVQALLFLALFWRSMRAGSARVTPAT